MVRTKAQRQDKQDIHQQIKPEILYKGTSFTSLLQFQINNGD